MADLQTFHVPEYVSGTPEDHALAREMIGAWRRDGIFQVAATIGQTVATQNAFAASRAFFAMPQPHKASCISDLTYSGYIASGEEITAGEADFPEIFTVCKDMPLDNARVRNAWPCHGPVPWPDTHYRQSMTEFMEHLGEIGENLLRLAAIGLGLEDLNTLTRLTDDGWHHMRVLRFPAASSAPASARGIGAHTDYGLLVIAAQDEVGGLYVRPPVEGEIRRRNWLASESSAGMYENDAPWNFVKPVPNVFTVFPGDILQFITGDHLLSTPHKVKLAARERYAMAYFHEPHFDAVVRPLADPDGSDCIEYGSHFTNMFMRCYQDRITTKRIIAENRLSKLAQPHDALIRRAA
jgi:2-oxoglutarate dioxygenase / 2-oxoglutarate/L-arginine monooxygenase/decarboxylase